MSLRFQLSKTMRYGLGLLFIPFAMAADSKTDKLFLSGPQKIEEQVRYVATASAAKFAIVTINVTQAVNCWIKNELKHCQLKGRVANWLLERAINEELRSLNNELSIGYAFPKNNASIDIARGQNLIVFITPAKTSQEKGHYAATAILAASSKNRTTVRKAIKDFSK